MRYLNKCLSESQRASGSIVFTKNAAEVGSHSVDVQISVGLLPVNDVPFTNVSNLTASELECPASKHSSFVTFEFEISTFGLPESWSFGDGTFQHLVVPVEHHKAECVLTGEFFDLDRFEAEKVFECGNFRYNSLFNVHTVWFSRRNLAYDRRKAKVLY